jgi:hypothetical protein
MRSSGATGARNRGIDHRLHHVGSDHARARQHDPNVALAHIQGSLSASREQVTWVLTYIVSVEWRCRWPAGSPGDVYFWGSLMGACLIASVPIAIVYNLFVDRFVAGFTVGAIK